MTLFTGAFNVLNAYLMEAMVLPLLYKDVCDLLIEEGTLSPKDLTKNGVVVETTRNRRTKIGITMVLSDPALELPMPMLPTFEYVGHVLSSPAAALPEGEIKEFVEGSQGFMLVSFGTIGTLQQAEVNLVCVCVCARAYVYEPK